MAGWIGLAEPYSRAAVVLMKAVTRRRNRLSTKWASKLAWAAETVLAWRKVFQARNADENGVKSIRILAYAAIRIVPLLYGSGYGGATLPGSSPRRACWQAFSSSVCRSLAHLATRRRCRVGRLPLRQVSVSVLICASYLPYLAWKCSGRRSFNVDVDCDAVETADFRHPDWFLAELASLSLPSGR